MVFYLYALSAVHCITATGNVYPDREAVVCINNANLSLLGLYGKDRDTCWCTTPPGLETRMPSCRDQDCDRSSEQSLIDSVSYPVCTLSHAHPCGWVPFTILPSATKRSCACLLEENKCGESSTLQNAQLIKVASIAGSMAF
ncbi:hypothetical protein C8Q72DRAFT_605964 [Fomitopsis betulina]|nr:hypothetical protein C8Q72DRAFT_605964 [Fomitopsis betulina]